MYSDDGGGSPLLDRRDCSLIEKQQAWRYLNIAQDIKLGLVTGNSQDELPLVAISSGMLPGQSPFILS